MNGKSFAAWVLVLPVVGGVLTAPGRASASSQDSVVEVTFTKHVLPIMQRACQQCHRPGSVAPMSLLTYEEVRPWARAIKDRTAQREMPRGISSAMSASARLKKTRR